MGKGGELWDDSTLLDAFDRAVASYKAMRGKNTQATPCESEKVKHAAATAEEGEPISAEATDEHIEKDDNSKNAPCGVTETPLQPSEERQSSKLLFKKLIQTKRYMFQSLRHCAQMLLMLTEM